MSADKRELTEVERVGLDELLRRARYEAARRILRAAGHEPGSVEIVVERDRQWLESGSDGEK